MVNPFSSSIQIVYVRFSVSGIAFGSVLSARLWLTARQDSTKGGCLYSVADTTFSSGITYNTRPAIGAQVGTCWNFVGGIYTDPKGWSITELGCSLT